MLTKTILKDIIAGIFVELYHPYQLAYMSIWPVHN
jgi:hypothetical protein